MFEFVSSILALPPLTCKRVVGLDVPIPTLPEELIRIASAPPSVKAIVSAAGKNTPVLVSPVVVIAGKLTVPAENVATPLNEPVVAATVPPDRFVAVVAVTALPPIDREVAVPVMFVPTKAEGVPNAGVTKVGLVDNTTLPVPVLVVTPVPPFATANVPLKVIAPAVAVAGVKPVVPPLNVDTPELLTTLFTNAVVAICVVSVPRVAVGAVGVPVSAGDTASTTPPVPVEAVVEPVPPFATGNAVPDNETARVPDVVKGLPVTERNVGTVIPTLVTVPVPAPIAVLYDVASSVETVLSAFILGNVIALGFVTVKKLLPTVVAPRLVLAPLLVVEPVPPLATASVPASVTAPGVAADGVNPVVPALNVVTPEEIAPMLLITNAVEAICVVAVPFAAVGAVGTPVNAGETENTAEPVPVSSVSAAAKLALDGVAKNVATPVPKPETPVETGRPVQLVNVPEEGVPSAGVVSVGLAIVGLVSITNLVPVPVWLAILVAFPTEVIGPVKLALVASLPLSF